MPSRLSRFLGILAYLVMACAPLHSQVPSLRIPPTGVAIVRLDGPWQFHTGDSAGWSSPALNDADWETIAVDRPWGMQSHFGYSGFAWYRRHLHFDQPASLALLLPQITQVYQVFWNGRLIAPLRNDAAARLLAGWRSASDCHAPGRRGRRTRHPGMATAVSLRRQRRLGRPQRGTSARHAGSHRGPQSRPSTSATMSTVWSTTPSVAFLC